MHIRLCAHEPSVRTRVQLFYAAENGRADAVHHLAHLGTTVHVQDSEGTSALHLAALGGHTDCTSAC